MNYFHELSGYHTEAIFDVRLRDPECETHKKDPMVTLLPM